VAVRRASLLPIALAVALDGVAFGLLAHTVGFGPVVAVAFSVLAVSGSAQFAALSIVGSGGGALSAGLTALLLNARCIPIGISVAPLFRGRLWWRALTAQLVFDESWAYAQTAPGRWNRRLLFAAGAAVYVGWVVGTALGAVGGTPLGDPKRFGVDAVFPAFFLALLAPFLTSRRSVAAALTGAGIALALTPVTPAGVAILAAGAGCLAGVRR
jgi:4-azaleucine resistance transporter AzlC